MLLAVGALAVDGGDLLGGCLELHEGLLVLGAGDELGGKRALGRQQEEAHAKQGVGAGGEDGDLAVGRRDAVLGGKREVNLCALGAADPVCAAGP